MTDLFLLLTPADLARAAQPDGGGRYQDVLDGESSDDAERLTDEMRAAIDYAQNAVADRLGYHPLVHAVTQASRPFLSPTASDGPFLASGQRSVGYVYATDRPVVQAFTTGVEAGPKTIAYAGTYPTAALSYAAGWRGAHHVLGGEGAFDLTTLPGLSNLTTLPALMPGDVRSVLVELALIDLDKRRLNLLGGKRNTVEIGEGTYRSEGYRATAETEALSRLSRLHRIPRA